MTKRITAHLTVEYIPLPAEKIFAYREALRTMLLAGKQSSPAQGGDMDEAHGNRSSAYLLPGAGMANPSTPFESPAGLGLPAASSPSLQAKLFNGDAG